MISKLADSVILFIDYYDIKYKKTHQFKTPCKSDKVTRLKQHKSFFFWDNVIERSHCTYNPLDVTPFIFCTASLSRE